MTRSRLVPLSLLGLAAGLLAAAALPYLLAWKPAEREPATVSCTAQAPHLLAGQALKVMTWNVQGFTGSQEQRPDASRGERRAERVDAAEVAANLAEAARIVREENPDLLLLQDVHDGDGATARQDQLAQLQQALGELYPCSGEAFYRKARWLPDPRESGPVGIKLALLSRFHIDAAERVQLPTEPGNWLSAPFAARPALLVAELPMRGAAALTVATTRLDSAAGGNAIGQATELGHLMADWQIARRHWLVAGDWNLPYTADGRTHVLPPNLSSFRQVPRVGEIAGPGQRQWATFQRGEELQVFDHLFHGNSLKRLEATVRQQGTAGLSNHRPLMVRLLLPAGD
ncbi:endonuclease/exonuclease/phosphatase family protein [Stutzerimonas nosocomialis]|uniref:endonuclease/exonuclease/phosphatase family protein n=1 Tax=Stutzerimonas nosocomialis TaxID=1056496 RepID=UPI001109E2BA|nr:endonuclease/exonuclease/phosphatase family protein [Stutzerimonas nosocomialis]TLX60641.1 endonuclease/exonuclease/phosphatase family protein [Stutzerimonas nosocomialis]